jgi:chitinase
VASWLTAVVVAGAACGTSGSPAPSPGAAARLVGYYAAWTAARGYTVDKVPAERLTHLIYAFADVSAGGDCMLAYSRADPANLGELAALKGRQPRLRTMLSVGGASFSPHFGAPAKTDALRRHLAQTCVALMRREGFDGLDIDWEFPTATGQPPQFVDLVTALRAELDLQAAADHRHPYLLTVALPAGPKLIAALPLAQIEREVDWINLMAYDFATATSPITEFNAPLFAAPGDPSPEPKKSTFNIDAAVRAYLLAGVPAGKVVVGVPFAGHGWSGVADMNHGLYQKHSGVPRGTWSEGGVFDYADLERNYLGGYSVYWSDDAQAAWLYDSGARVMISYEEPRSLAAKASYVKRHGLGGIMVWQLAADDHQGTLLVTLQAHLSTA